MYTHYSLVRKQYPQECHNIILSGMIKFAIKRNVDPHVGGYVILTCTTFEQTSEC